MAERPILFSGEMVRAILDGRKTQTRRVVKTQPSAGQLIDECHYSSTGWAFCDDTELRGCHCSDEVKCPYGMPGDRLWVRETWHAPQCYDDHSGRSIANGVAAVGYTVDAKHPACCLWYPSTGTYRQWSSIASDKGRARPPRFMPRWASRILLKVTDVRVERVQDISDADAMAEGVNGGCVFCGDPQPCGCPMPSPDHKDAFCYLWDSINAKRPGCSWDDNPWVWVVEFERE